MAAYDFLSVRLFVDAPLGEGQPVALDKTQQNYLGNVLRLKAGARIHEYDPTMIHAKVLVIDGLWSVVGSTNFDNRSFGINDEINVAAFDGDTKYICGSAGGSSAVRRTSRTTPMISTVSKPSICVKRRPVTGRPSLRYARTNASLTINGSMPDPSSDSTNARPSTSVRPSAAT